MYIYAFRVGGQIGQVQLLNALEAIPAVIKERIFLSHVGPS